MRVCRDTGLCQRIKRCSSPAGASSVTERPLSLDPGPGPPGATGRGHSPRPAWSWAEEKGLQARTVLTSALRGGGPSQEPEGPAAPWPSPAL